MTASLKLCLAPLLVAGVTGCATPVAAPEDGFGQALAAARTRQMLNPVPAQPRWNGAGMDGTAAYESILRYQETFKAPPPTFVIINAAPGGGGK